MGCEELRAQAGLTAAFVATAVEIRLHIKGTSSQLTFFPLLNLTLLYIHSLVPYGRNCKLHS